MNAPELLIITIIVIIVIIIIDNIFRKSIKFVHYYNSVKKPI